MVISRIFLKLLYQLLEGTYERKIHKQEWRQKKKKSRRKTGKRTKKRNAGPKKSTSSRNVGPSIPRHAKIQNSKRGAKMEKENARIARKERTGAIAKKVVDIYIHDLDYRFLYEGVIFLRGLP